MFHAVTQGVPSGIDPDCLLRSLVTLLLSCLATLSSSLTKLPGLLPKQTFYTQSLPQDLLWDELQLGHWPKLHSLM